MLCSGFSTRLMMSRSTDSGDAPGYGKLITITGCSTSGIWLTRRFFSASRPRHIRTMMIATVVTGCLMLKLESNIAYGSLKFLRLLFSDGHRLRTTFDAHRLVGLQRRVRKTQHRIAFHEPGLHDVCAGARVALAELDFGFLQLRVLDRPRVRLVALAHERGA